MADALEALEPRSLWGAFANLLQLPRPSKHEERVVAWIRATAQEHGWEVLSDAVGNLVVQVPATPGHADAPTVILQAHLDMVCEKNRGTQHDFMRDPIRAHVVDGWVAARDTTLGADNGIGVAAALAAATDPAVVHGPLELLFTLDEETGLTGAAGLDGSLLRGRLLINMDSEEDGKLFVGCAGGSDCKIDLRVRRTDPAAGSTPWRIAAAGLRGGHSGLNIGEGRGNALRVVQRVLGQALDDGVAFELAAIEGGDKHNAIPREAEATVWASAKEGARLCEVAERMRAAFADELHGVDDGLRLTVEPATDAVATVLATEDRDRLLHLLAVLPHGVLAMSRDLPGLVETSSNLAAVRVEGATVHIVTSSRSSIQPALDAVIAGIRAAGALAGARVETHDGYPGWKPNLDSRALDAARRAYVAVWGRDPEVTAVHAGLECGLLGEKLPALDMISFGPQIEGAHSPDERVEIASVGRFWEALSRVLADLARATA